MEGLLGVISKSGFNPITETTNYINRVEADGGTIGDKEKLDVLIRALVDNSIYTNLSSGYTRLGGYKESGGTITKLYDLSTNDRDVTTFLDAPELDSGGVGFVGQGSTEWDAVLGDRSLNEWSVISWIKPNVTDTIMLVHGDNFGHETVYINVSNNSMYYIDSNTDYNFIGNDGATYLNNWNCFAWDGSNSNDEVKGWENGQLAGTLTSGLNQTNDGRFRDEEVFKEIQGLWDLYLLYEERLTASDYDAIYQANKSIYGH